jgi:AcrR family transcriptional regulator
MNRKMFLWEKGEWAAANRLAMGGTVAPRGSSFSYLTTSTGILVFMRALPGRASRANLDAPATVTRSSAHADQRRRILRAIGELVAERGYADVTVEQIVKRAHVSYKTFYKHHRSKAECFADLFDTAFASTEKKIRERLAAGRLPWSQQVILALRTLFEAIAAEPVISRAVIVETPMVGPEVLERYQRASAALAPLFRAGRELNPRGAELPSTLEETLSGAVFWSAYQYLIVDEAGELAPYLPVVLELVLRTYLGPAEASRIARAEPQVPQPALA